MTTFVPYIAVLVLDILAGVAEDGHPVAAPLPLGTGAGEAEPELGGAAGAGAGGVGVAVSPAEAYGPGWRCVPPDVVLDSARGLVWWGGAGRTWC